MTRHPACRRAISRAATAALVLLAASTPLAACGESDEADDEASASSTTSAEAPAALTITGAWARTSPMVSEAGAAYLTIANDGGVDDALVTVTVDPSVAARAELHEVVVSDPAGSSGGMGDGMTVGTNAGGEMLVMRPVERIPVAAGGATELKPGSYHIMLMELVKPLATGDTFELVLGFETSGEQVVTVEVRDVAP